MTVLAIGGAGLASAASGWSPTGSMTVAHRTHDAVLLDDGRVLVNGGYGMFGLVPVAELYDPTTGTWSQAAPPLVPRRHATATKLLDGRVLVVGGDTASNVATGHAELYSAVENTWTATGSMAQPRQDHEAVLLNDGRVLVTGGTDDDGGVPFSSAEIYDPATGTWTPAAPMGEGRTNHQATLLADGRVLVTGGGYDLTGTDYYRSSSEIYHPITNSWTPTAPMAEARGEMAGARLPDGTVLVTAGRNTTGAVTGSERFDPVTGTWASAGTSGVTGFTAEGVVLHDGRFLLSAWGSRSTPLFDPTAPSATAWSTRHATGMVRGQPSMTLLSDGRVLLAGGDNLTSAELFTPPTERGHSGGTFAAIDPGSAVEQDVTLTNEGGNPLWIDGTGITGPDVADFSEVTDGCTGKTLQPTQTCVVRVRFAPSATGLRRAELAVDDNAETSPAVELTGGVATPPVDPPVLPPLPPRTPAPPADPTPPATVPVGCTRPYVALVGITATGGSNKPRARLSGLAAPSLAGRTVTVLRGTRKVGSTRIATDGRINVTVPAPRNARARDIARYRLSISGTVRSAALKATRRVASARRATLADGRVRVTGRVAGIRRPTTLQVRSTPVCGPKVDGTRVRTDAKGRFRVTVAAPPSGVPAVVHRVWLQKRSVTLPIVVTAKH